MIWKILLSCQGQAIIDFGVVVDDDVNNDDDDDDDHDYRSDVRAININKRIHKKKQKTKKKMECLKKKFVFFLH